MKNFIKLIALMLALIMIVGVLVACGGSDDPSDPKKDDPKKDDPKEPGDDDPKEPGDDDPEEPGDDDPEEPGEDDPKDPVIGKNITVKFIIHDPDANLDYEYSKTQAANKKPVSPKTASYYDAKKYPTVTDFFENYVIEGWDKDNDGIDDPLEKLKADTTYKAIVRQKKMCNVTFYGGIAGIGEGVKEITTIQIKEGKDATAEADKIAPTIVVGMYFNGWASTGEVMGSLAAITDDCEFTATYKETDATIPMVAKGSITVDGLRDEAYKNAAILPLDTSHQADENHANPTAAIYDPDKMDGAYDYTSKKRIISDTRAVGYLAWDGDWIYFLIDVYDTTLSGRDQSYVKLVANSYMNDAVELWHAFTQGEATLANSGTKFGMDAMGMKMYANVGLGEGAIGTVRSVYMDGFFPELTPEVKVASAIGSTGAYGNAKVGQGREIGLTEAKLSAEGKVELTKTHVLPDVATEFPSYRVEIKLPAYTEGGVDTSKRDDGLIPNETTGELGMLDGGAWVGANGKTDATTGKYTPSTNLADYAFVKGDKLVAGNIIRASLQLNDLVHSQDDLADKTGPCHEDPDKNLDPAVKREYSSYLYSVEGKEVYPKFCAYAHTQGQYGGDIKKFFTYSLSDRDEGMSKVVGFDEDGNYLDKDGQIVKDFHKADE